jgi:glutamyl-Q tRNA(Asp) synthetase
MNTTSHPTPYRGRFAPTPSGPLHFGSLVAALGSFLEARAHDGAWLVRMEDVDPPRVVAGAADDILRTLEAFGFEWDGPVMRQSRRGDAYRDALARLDRTGLLYACACSRKRLGESARRGVDGPVYPGTCRGRRPGQGEAALRLSVPDRRIVFEDALQGRVACDLAAECGDFVVRRADGVVSYQLAVVVDDAEQGISHVARGADLLTSTPRQIILQDYLDLPTPAYLHLPVALDERGDKLSKQTLAERVDARAPLPALFDALRFLGVPADRSAGNVGEFWEMAAGAWSADRLPRLRGKRLAPPSACSPRAPA